MTTFQRIFTAAAAALLLVAVCSPASAQTTVRASSSGAKTTTMGSSQAGRKTVDRKETTVTNSNVTNKGLTTVRTTTTPTRTSGSTTTRTSGTSTTRTTGTTTSRTGSTATSSSTPTRTTGTTTTGSTSSTTGSTTATSGSSSSGSTTRVSGSSTASTTARQSGTATTSQTARQSGTSTTQRTQTTGQSQTQTTTNRNQGQSGSAVRSNPNVTAKPKNTGRPERDETYTDRGGNFRYGGANNMDIKGDGRDVQRMPPMDRQPIPYSAPARFNTPKPHYYGYNIATMPHGYITQTYWGRTYYSYNGIWYQQLGSYYRVCRPPYGTEVRFGLCKKGLTSVRFSYYNSVDHAYSAINQNYAIIAEQNRIIAQNNAIIAAQNARLALNSTNANVAYLLASQLGLIQSYASATTNYYYQDGVFYTGTGRNFRTILPPAGAIIASLPEDYIIEMFGGNPYYRVENTLYRQFVVDGAPYFEVLGQYPY